MKKYIIFIIILIVILVTGTVAFSVYKNINSKPSEEDLKEKANQEIKYLDSTIVTLVNHFHNISYANYTLVETEISVPKTNNQQQGSSSSSESQQSEGTEQESGANEEEKVKNTNIVANSILTNGDSKINWDYLMEETELIYSSWPATLVDLSSLNVSSDNLLNFTNTLDDVVDTLKDKDIKNSLLKLSDLYNLLITYLREYSNDNTMINTFSVRGNIIKAYALAETDNWDEMKKSIATAKTEYNNILNNAINTNNINSINKGYILLNELDKNLNNEDKDIFYINYRNLMQELRTII